MSRLDEALPVGFGAMSGEPSRRSTGRPDANSTAIAGPAAEHAEVTAKEVAPDVGDALSRLREERSDVAIQGA